MAKPTDPSEPKPVSVPTTLVVSRTVKFDRDEAQKADVSETIAIHQFATQPAMVPFATNVKMCVEYCSAGIDIGVNLPCYKEEIADGMQAAYNLVMERLAIELPKVIKLATDLAEKKRSIESGMRR